MTESNPLVANYREGVGELSEIAPEDLERARKTVARNAVDAADLGMLLDMLDLRERPAGKVRRRKS